MQTIAFALANYAARPLNYHMDHWAQGERATSASFQSVVTFRAHLATYLDDVRVAGFTAVDFWQPMLDQQWTTRAHLDIAASLLAERGMQVVGFAGSLGDTREAFVRNCEICAALDCSLLVGAVPLARTDRDFVVESLHAYGLKWGYEHEEETTPAEILAKIGDSGDGVIGICADVGWFSTYGYDAAAALQQLASRLFHVHLKDVLAQGAHDTCRFGRGIVPLERCVRVLKAINYDGAMVIEHETARFDPTEDVRDNLVQLRRWLAQP